MKVLYIYRSKKLKQFSIERCFRIIREAMPDGISIDELYLPEERAHLSSILKNLIYVKRYLKKNKYDVIQITGDAHYIALATGKTKTVLTIHDLRGLDNYQGIKKLIYKLLWINLPCKCSDIIVPISNYTKSEIDGVTQKYDSKITVIPDPIDNIIHYDSHLFNKNNPRLLMIGTGYNKNLNRVIEAIDGVPCTLDIVGKLSNETKKLLEDKSIYYVNSSGISDTEIFKKYCLSDIVIFPSLYEGFGMIVVEGQMVGRPVLTSNIEPMITVANEAACLVDPYNVNSIREGILKIISDDAYRKQLIDRGVENSKNYKASIVSQMYADTYRSLI